MAEIAFLILFLVLIMIADFMGDMRAIRALERSQKRFEDFKATHKKREAKEVK